ncbi:MAG TPA: hypothetical protein VGQ37_26735 [Vicinamibacterales bacterium]|nr:hypothetical protein [Vicinamibacterales bacterium]
MHIRSTLPVCLLLSLFASTQADAQFRPEAPMPPGENFHVELGLMFWQPTPGIVIGSDSLRAVNATGVDLVQQFAIDSQRFKEFRAVLHGGKNKLRISHVDLVYNETATLQQAVVIGGRPFNIAANATADLDWELWKLGYEHDFVKSAHGLLGFIAEVNFNHVVANLSASSQGLTATSLTDEKVPFPALGAVARVYPHKNVGIGAEWTGFKMPGFIANKLTDTDNGAAHMKNFDVYVTGSITRYFGVQGGYRALSADYLLDTDTGDLEMKGFYFGGMVRF